jgi:guanyl-specific ribonuclease Sa
LGWGANDSIKLEAEMPDIIDVAVEERALREHGILGRGDAMGNALYAIDFSALPPEAHATIQTIINAGPFPYPNHDGRPFQNRFGDLPSQGDYLEFTVPTPGAPNRGGRRIVARRNGILFFTACHYERVQGAMSPRARQLETAKIDARWRNGFYVVTGMPLNRRQQIAEGIRRIRGG